MKKEPQKILYEESEKYKRGCASDIPAQWHNIAINSMEVFGEEEAIEFAKWIMKNAVVETHQGQDGWNYFRGIGQSFIDTKKLYEAYKHKTKG